MPEHGSDESQDHRKLRELVAEGCTRKYGERYMAFSSSIAIQGHRDGHDGRSDDDGEHCLLPRNSHLGANQKGQVIVSPGQSHGQDSTSRSPTLDADHITDPVAKDGPACPRAP